MKPVREHPWMTAILAVGGVGGAAFSYVFGPADLSPTRRIVGGVIAGLGVALTIILTRILGAFSDKDDV